MTTPAISRDLAEHIGFRVEERPEKFYEP